MDRRRGVIIGTAGHIDHGKTALVLALTGVDTDRLPEEKRRGITIELGFAPLTLDGLGTIGVVDVPGHEAFVRTMVAGATGIDLALVVVAADEGVMPQTREHLAILELLGVRAGVIALTKADLVDDEWLELVEEDVRAATARALPDAAIVATSVHTGRGIPELRASLLAAAQAIAPRGSDDLFRMPVDRAFTVRGTGTVVTGTVWSGRLTQDDTVRILPGTATARVRGIQGHGSQLDVALPGGRTAIALVGVDVAAVPRGSSLVTDREWRTTTLARAEVTLVPGVELVPRPRTWFRLHTGTSEVGARIVSRDARAGEPFSARLVLDAPVLLRAGDRFVVRTSAPLNTIAGGVITDPCAPRRARAWPAGLSVDERLDRLVSESGADGLEIATLPVRLGASPARCRALVENSADRFVVTATRIVARGVFVEVERQLLAATRRHHDEHPLDAGAPTQTLREAVRASAEVTEAALQSRFAAGELKTSSGLVALAEWAPTPSRPQVESMKTLVSMLETAGAEPPSVEELSSAIGQDAGVLIRYLERRGDVVQVEQNRYYAADELKKLVGRVREAMIGGEARSPAQLREALGLSRKFLIPFLEYCDRAGYTARSDAGRSWRGA